MTIYEWLIGLFDGPPVEASPLLVEHELPSEMIEDLDCELWDMLQ